MNPQNNPNNDMTPEEAKASLGLSTTLVEQILGQQAQEQAMMQGEGMEGSEMGETAPEPTGQPEVEETPEVDIDAKVDQKMEVLRAEMKELIRQEVGGIRADIKEALNGQED